MLVGDFQAYVDAARAGSEICVAVCSVETGGEIAVSFDVVAGINVYGELVIEVDV